MSTEKAVEKQETVEQTIDIDAEKRGGVKEAVQNEEVIAMAQDKIVAGKAAEKPSVKPSFFIKKTARHTIKVDVLTSQDDGRIVSVSRTGLGINFEKDFQFMDHSVLEFTFSVPNYEDMSTYRQRSSIFRREIQQTIVDKISLRNFLMVWHLKDWNLTDEEGKKIDLVCDSNGPLSDDSTAVVYALSPTLIDVVMTVLEKDLLLN